MKAFNSICFDRFFLNANPLCKISAFISDTFSVLALQTVGLGFSPNPLTLMPCILMWFFRRLHKRFRLHINVVKKSDCVIFRLLQPLTLIEIMTIKSERLVTLQARGLLRTLANNEVTIDTFACDYFTSWDLAHSFRSFIVDILFSCIFLKYPNQAL